jgi:thiamine biosynthesis lipoprotein
MAATTELAVPDDPSIDAAGHVRPTGHAHPTDVRTIRRSFRSMGTDVTLIGPASAPVATFDDAFRTVRSIFEREDRRFSRFRAGSEISRVNAAAGSWTAVSKPFRRVLRAGLEAAETTGGLFDPTVLPALMAAGYDRDFDDIIAGARLALHPPEPCGRWREIRTRDGEILLPEGVALDFGGIAKGWTVDRAAESIRPLMAWALVDAGGDLRIVGEVPEDGLEIAIEDPHDATVEILRLGLDHGALATTPVTLRTWGPGMHHVIDPRTGRPAQTGVLQATVWAPTCTAAELGSKWALLDDERALARVPAVIVRDDGTIVTNMADGAADGGAMHP